METTYKCEYAKTSRSSCKACKKPLMENTMRVGKSSPSPFFDGFMLTWYHATCFFKKFGGKVTSITQVAGWDLMRPEDQAKLRELTGDQSSGATAAPSGSEASSVNSYWQLKDEITKHIVQKEAKTLLEKNKQPTVGSLPVLIDRLADSLFYGIAVCPMCKQRDMTFREGRYNCNAETEWGRCGFEGLSGVITERFVGAESSAVPAIRAWNQAPQPRAVVATVRKAISEYTRDTRQPLKNMCFTAIGWLERPHAFLKALIQQNGGTWVAPEELNGDVDYVLTTFGDVVRGKDQNIMKAIQLRLALVSETLLDRLLTEFGFDQRPYLLAGQLPPIGLAKLAPPANAPPPADATLTSGPGGSSKEAAASAGAETKMKLGAVDCDAGLGEQAKVYTEDVNGKPSPMDVVLSQVDVATGINKYYRMQVIDVDGSNKKFLAFFKWGRIGVSVGSSTKTGASSLSSAIGAFEEKYLDKTGNNWKDRHNFVKKPGKYFPLDIESDDKGSESEEKKDEDDASLIPSYLDPRVQDLIKLIFDVDMLTKQMVSLNIDVRKMPLGKISKSMVQHGYQVLREIEEAIQKNEPNKQVQLMNLSSKFYTLVPHDFGRTRPPTIDSFDMLKLKQQQLEALMDISIASQLLSSNTELTRTHPLDRSYDLLGIDIKPMNKFSREWKTIQKYVSNGHNPKSLKSNLQLLDAYTVSRPGEQERFKPFMETRPRKLLWHGSRLCNYVGILNQGLRIAPKEAPVTGYMFGKGLYFADLIEKSAPFCHPGDDKVGLLLLCEVALGEPLEVTKPTYVEKLPTGKLSTIAWGKELPDPAKDEVIDSTIVPVGAPVPSGKDGVFLAQSEYVVYNIDQVKIRYVVKIKFSDV